MTCPGTTLVLLTVVSQWVVLQNLRQGKGLPFSGSYSPHCFLDQAWKGKLVADHIRHVKPRWGGLDQWKFAPVGAQLGRHKPLAAEAVRLER